MSVLKGIDLPRRIGTEILDVFEPEQREPLERELQAIDQNVREILTRIETNLDTIDLNLPVSNTTLPSGLFIPVIVSSLPTLPNSAYPNGSLVVLTSDWKLYRNASGTWTAAVPTVDLTGTITTTQIDDLGVTTPKLAANAVTAAKIAAGTITASEIAAGTITAAEIAAGAIGAAEIAAGAVSTTQLNALAVTADKLAANSVTAAKINVASLSAISADMGTLTAGKIDVGSIEINAATERILMGAATAPATGVGIFLGKDGSDYELRVGDPAGEFIHWNGSTLTIKGETFTGTTPNFTGTIEIESGEGVVLYRLQALAGQGADFRLRDNVGTDRGRIYIPSSNNFHISAQTADLILEAAGNVRLTGIVNFTGGTTTGRTASSDYLTIEDGGTQRYLRLYD